jgi:hypothetical protein
MAASALPITFRGGSSSAIDGDRGDGSVDSVGGGVTGMIGDVGGRDGVTGGAYGRSCRRVMGGIRTTGPHLHSTPFHRLKLSKTGRPRHHERESFRHHNAPEMSPTSAVRASRWHYACGPATKRRSVSGGGVSVLVMAKSGGGDQPFHFAQLQVVRHVPKQGNLHLWRWLRSTFSTLDMFACL